MKKKLMFLLASVITVSGSLTAAPIKIMPVGNSITAGEHYREPALEERSGYRKDLYWMLTDAGYDVDFVGSQTHGIRSEDDPDWYDWNNEAYPGWQILDITKALEKNWENYKPDILLVHVGTNGTSWNRKPGQVMDMLDFLNASSIKHDHKMTVFLCKIINRFNGGHTETTQFNEAVADSVAARTGDQIKIIMVDMENGAGLDYSDAEPDPNANPPFEGGDMWGTKYPGVTNDAYHPNDKGNNKMAVKFYEELLKELGEPNSVIADYRFEVDASDATGNFDGKLENDASIVYDGKRANVLSLNDSGFVSLPPELANEMDDFSLAAWVKFSGTNPWAGLMGIGMAAGGTHPYWDFHLKSDNTIRFYSSVDVTWPSDGCAQKVINYTLPAEWTHVAFSFKKDSGAVVYINGAARELEAWTGDNDYSVSPADLTAEVFNIGKDAFNQTTLTHTLIDDFKFFKTALNEVAVAAIYNTEKTPVNAKIAYWNCDGNMQDAFGLSDGILHNMGDTPFVAGYIQQGDAIDFGSGTDSSYVEVPDNVLIDFDSTTSFSASVLVNVNNNDISGAMDVLFKGATGVDPDNPNKKGQWYSVSFKNNELRMAVDDNVSKSQLACPNAHLLLNERGWNHIVAVRDLVQDSLRLFLNGVQVASMEDMTDGNISTTRLPLIIGNSQNRDNNFKGLIDDIQLYNYAMDAAEVDALWQAYRIRVSLTSMEESVHQPLTYSLQQNYPNPFNPTTAIQFRIPKDGRVTISVFNSIGQQVAALIDEDMTIGSHQVTFDAAKFSSGIYFYKIQAGDFSQVKKMLLLR